MAIVYMGAGANHNPEENLRAGIRRLANSVAIQALSSVYETAPVETDNGKSYLNMALKIETDLNPIDLKTLLRQIENAQGRLRVDESGQKSTVVALDFDILLYDDVIDDKLPHSDILNYAHATIPLAEIAPDVIHPITGDAIVTIARQLQGKKGIKRHKNIRIK
ncbi:MAG: 2-amino-4-hydroxy-6-hydroxymethyldihydropteridine diphosphokinase [Aggregatilineales bacterium]